MVLNERWIAYIDTSWRRKKPFCCQILRQVDRQEKCLEIQSFVFFWQKVFLWEMCVHVHGGGRRHLWAVMCPFPTQRFAHSPNVPLLRVKDYQIGNLFPSRPFLPQHIPPLVSTTLIHLGSESERELYRKPNSIKTTSSTAPPFLSFTRISFISTGSLRVKFHETRKMIKLEKAIKLHKSALKLLPDISENILRDFPEKI